MYNPSTLHVTPRIPQNFLFSEFVGPDPSDFPDRGFFPLPAYNTRCHLTGTLFQDSNISGAAGQLRPPQHLTCEKQGRHKKKEVVLPKAQCKGAPRRWK